MRAQNQYQVTIQPGGSWPAFETTVSAATQYRAELLAVQQYRADYAASGCMAPSIAGIQCEELTPTITTVI
jgi:hypothetical protein